MAGYIHLEDLPNDDPILLKSLLFNHENLILHSHNLASPSSSPQTSTTQPQNGIITSPPIPLELRQNNPQDCSNLIIASVNSATVEISRTIIALNATFSQQLQQASISASNGIKSAQNSASSTVSVVSLNASIATSSAFSQVTVANRVATSANLAFTSVSSASSTDVATLTSSLSLLQATITSVSSASSTDVATLSSSLSLLQANLASVQSSASAAISAAQAAFASVTGSAAAQAASILASAAPGPSNQPLPTLQAPLPLTLKLTPGQAGAILAGAVVASILLTVAVFFLVLKMKKKKGQERVERDSYLDEKDFQPSPVNLPSRSSAAFRTGNAMTIKFNPPNSSDAPMPSRSALRNADEMPTASSPKAEAKAEVVQENKFSGFDFGSSIFSAGSLPSTYAREVEKTSDGVASPDINTWRKQNESEQSILVAPAPDRIKRPPSLNPFDDVHVTTTEDSTSSTLARPSSLAAEKTHTAIADSLPGETLFEKAMDYSHIDPFEDPPEPETFAQIVRDLPIEDLSAAPVEHEEEIFILSPRISLPTVQSRNDLPETIQFSRDDPSTSSSDLEFEESPYTQSEISVLEDETPEESHLALEQLLPQASTRVPSPETLALLRNDQQPRSSTVPEIDTLLLKVAEQNGHIGDKPLFWTDFRPLDPEAEESNLVLSFENPSAVVGESSVRVNEFDSETPIVELEETLLSPLRRPVEPEPHPPHPGYDSTSVTSPHLPSELGLKAVQAVSELQQEPKPLEEIPPLPIAQIPNVELQLPKADVGANDRDNRGRSMIRTSDIIEARLSAMVHTKSYESSKDAILDSSGAASPLARNPINLTMLPASERNRTISPLRRNPFISPTIKRKSRTISPRPQLKATVTTREESPLRRNLSSRRNSNANFSEALLRFQTLASKNPQDAARASDEVTQRAIAGISIPGSLREYAVRNLSKSRERGTKRERYGFRGDRQD
ncbi:hypothetical protein LSUE1_G001575 [Lachnellula suecica]|uniref:Uncharacterized protein n=1 Tax=Lachnellula suecica TaxID=602035 RepID=A0A8T9CBH9_9HELO|nr:hypothetical protein LSUE1_G001575 [Lachnellula suecica]